MKHMTKFSFLEYELDAMRVATVTLNRPPVNAVHRDMYIELAQLFAEPDQMGMGSGPLF